MSTPDEHITAQWNEVHRAEADLATLERLGVSTSDPAYLRLQKERGAALAKVGTTVSRDDILLAWSFGFSPGIIGLWHNGDAGFVSEARVKAGAPPVYHTVSGEEAVAIINRKVSKKLEKRLMAPDDYFGE